MAITVGDIIRRSMRQIGVLAAGEPLPDDEGADALGVFTQMVDAWTLETLLIPVVSVVTHQLVTDQAEYTIGIYPEPKPVPLPTNHIETARPSQFISAFMRDSTGTDYPLRTMDAGIYSSISLKTNPSRPSRYYVREGWPLSTILFDSVPYDTEALHLEVIQPLSELLSTAGLTEVINLPPGYQKALVDNLSLELAPEWGADIPPVVAAMAVQGKRLIKRRNSRTTVLTVDNAIRLRNSGLGSYKINQGP